MGPLVTYSLIQLLIAVNNFSESPHVMLFGNVYADLHFKMIDCGS